jgi:hypothetical protein
MGAMSVAGCAKGLLALLLLTRGSGASFQNILNASFRTTQSSTDFKGSAWCRAAHGIF